MPGRGSKDKYDNKQKRMAEHIKESEEERGADDKTASRIAWATVNKQTGGGRRKGGSGSGAAQDEGEFPTSHRPSNRKKAGSSARSGRVTKKKRSGSSIGVNRKRSLAAKKAWAKRRQSDDKSE